MKKRLEPVCVVRGGECSGCLNRWEGSAKPGLHSCRASEGGAKKRGLLESIQSHEWSGPGQISHIARC